MIVCPSCGQRNPDGFRLCGMCGVPLSREPAAGREERKVVTVLFCDLVGFTSKAEKLDPEDVRAILGPYHERVRSELERHGGTVEKFIGDAVMALFSAPRRTRTTRSGPSGQRSPSATSRSRRGSNCAWGSRPEKPLSRSTRISAR